MTWRLWWPYANKIIQRQGKRDIGASISSEPAQMKGRGIDLRDSNGHSLPHLSVRPSDLVTTNAMTQSGVPRQALVGVGSTLIPGHFRLGRLDEAAGVCGGRGPSMGFELGS